MARALRDSTDSLQTKEAIPHLRTSKGRIVYASSGAATGAYVSWGAYGSSKAAMNSLAKHVAVEEPDVIAVAVSPGRVDTGMQREIREKGTEMSKTDREEFTAAFEEGKLVKPEQSGGVISELSRGAQPGLTGEDFTWEWPELAEDQS